MGQLASLTSKQEKESVQTKQWKRMSSGKYIALNESYGWEPDINDINTSLNQMKRFNGHHKDEEPLTVAQHSYLCMLVCEIMYPNDKRTLLGCLVHDWPEAYYGDIATPFKKMMGDYLRKVTDPIDERVFETFFPDFTWDEDLHDRVKVCDLISLDIERRAMWKSAYGKDKWPDVPSTDLLTKDKLDLFKQAQKGPIDLRKLYEEYK